MANVSLPEGNFNHFHPIDIHAVTPPAVAEGLGGPADSMAWNQGWPKKLQNYQVFRGCLEAKDLTKIMVVSNRNLLFQGSIFRGYVSFREGSWSEKEHP